MKKGLLVALSLSALTVSAANAADMTNTGSSSSDASSILSNLHDNMYLNYFGIYHGAPLTSMDSTKTVGPTGVPSKTNAINFDSEITAAYMITPSFGIGPDVPFLMVPVLGQGIILGDVGIKAIDKKTVYKNGLIISTNLYLQAPTSKASEARNMDLGIKTTPSIRYTMPGSRITLGAWNEIKEYAGVTSDKTFKLYTQPYANYQLSKNFSLNLGYEMEWHHNVGYAAARFTTYQTDLQPGFVWNITPKVIVNPYIQIFTANAMSTDTAAVGAVISATAF